jgi:hypothetical protein
MSNSQITFRAIAPIYSPLSLHLGVDQFSKAFIKSLKAVTLDFFTGLDEKPLPLNWQGKILHLGGQQNEDRQYQSTDQNSKDVRLMCWSPAENDNKNSNASRNVMFHLFTNHIAIAEVELTIDITALKTSSDSNDELVKLIEVHVQQLAQKQIDAHFNDFCQDLKQLKLYLSDDFVFSQISGDKTVNWVARTMLITDEQLTLYNTQRILTSWLKKTSRPEDAAEIIAGQKDYSMTWLNYVVKNAKAVGEDPQIQIMVLSQYYYVTQENCNNALRGAIETAYARGKKQKVDQVLAKTRTACRLNRIAYFENIKFLNRPNRALLEDILNGWKFDQLVDNSERMIEICNTRLQEEDNKKRERSTVMTDFLLVTLSFFSVFELSLYLTEFSREMMSRPALDYNDNKKSFFLSIIAEIDADIMFFFGFGLTLLLIIVYRYIKRNQ